MACNHQTSCSSCSSDVVSLNCNSEKAAFIRKRILIYCTGNSCRSQMAEGWLTSFDDRLDVYSAGTKPEKKLSPFAMKVMEEVGIDISYHYPKSVLNFVNQDFDYVISVCDNAKNICPPFSGNVKKYLHIRFDDPADASGSEDEILAVYRKVRDLIRDDFYNFFKQL